MVQVIEEQRRPSFSQKFSRGVGTGLEEGSKLYQSYLNKKEEEDVAKKFKEQFGIDLPREGREAFSKAYGKSAGELPGKERLKVEELEKFETGLETVNDLREIASRKNIGRGSSFLGLFPGDTAKDRAEFEQLGKSLIPLVAAGVPIRNQKEFEEYKKVITDPSSSLSAIEGALDGLERIFHSKVKGERKKSGKVKFNLSNPEHKAKRDQVLKDLKGDREKAKQVLEREFDL